MKKRARTPRWVIRFTSIAGYVDIDMVHIFDRLCKLEKRGDEIKKKSSPLKLLGQSQPNFAEMILGWPPFKIYGQYGGKTS
jgi:hypothetical protein